jgi:nucleotide-binding universal stress UspA family protein
LFARRTKEIGLMPRPAIESARETLPSPVPTSARGSDPPASSRRAIVVPYIVLVGLDLSEPGGRAWRFAFDVAKMHGDHAEVHAVVVGSRDVAPPIRDLKTPGATSVAPEERQRPLKVLQHRSTDGDARLMAMHFRTGRPDRAIVQLAKEIDADLIVVAKQPTTTLQRFLGGSIADRIARDAPCPVVVVRAKDAAE